MKKALLAAVLAATAHIPQAHAQSCVSVTPGWLVINHRVGVLFGKSFYARVACSRFAPVLVAWRGGGMCPGRYFYGRNGDGQPFSCKVLSWGKR